MHITEKIPTSLQEKRTSLHQINKRNSERKEGKKGKKTKSAHNSLFFFSGAHFFSASHCFQWQQGLITRRSCRLTLILLPPHRCSSPPPALALRSLGHHHQPEPKTSMSLITTICPLKADTCDEWKNARDWRTRPGKGEGYELHYVPVTWLPRTYHVAQLQVKCKTMNTTD